MSTSGDPYVRDNPRKNSPAVNYRSLAHLKIDAQLTNREIVSFCQEQGGSTSPQLVSQVLKGKKKSSRIIGATIALLATRLGCSSDEISRQVYSQASRSRKKVKYA